MEPLEESRASSRDFWLGLVVALAGPVAAWFGLRGLPLEFLLILAGLWLLVTGLCWRRQLLTLLGPLFLYEIIRETRRSRYFLLRVYCYLMVFILFIAALVWRITGTSLVLTRTDAARISQLIALMLLGAHLLLVTLIVPVYVGAAVAGDKERRTLEFLMVTELDSKEILLGKLAVRLAIVVLMLLTGLPILALLQFVGGLDADLILGGFAATLAYTFGLACLALYNSVRARRTRDAILRTYLVLVGYVFLSWVFSNLLVKTQRWLNPFPPRFAWAPGSGPPKRPWVSYLFEYLDLVRVGSPFMINDLVREQLNLGKTPGQAFTLVLFEFIGFYTIAGLLLLGLALIAFRKVFKQEQEIVSLVVQKSGRRLRPVGNHPFLWKELWVEGAARPGWLRILLTILVVLGSFAPFWFIQNQEVMRLNSSQPMLDFVRHDEKTRRDHASYTFAVSTVILSLFLLQLAVRASSSFSRERERQTLDSLLACPTTPEELMAAKWDGTMLSIRLAWLWPMAIWLIGILYGGVPVLAFVILFVNWLICAGTITCLGQWYSLKSSSSTRAMINTLATVGLLYIGTLALPMHYRGKQPPPDMLGAFREWLFQFQISMAPAFAFDRLVPAVTASNFRGASAEDWEVAMLTLSTFVWLWAGLFFWRRNMNLLRREMCPME